MSVADVTSLLGQYRSAQRGLRCVLVAIATAADNTRLPQIMESLSGVCEAHTWVRAAVNFYSGAINARTPRVGLPSCATQCALPGFKNIFWKKVLVPEALMAFSHVFVVDSDMELAPDRFEWQPFLGLMRSTNVSIFSPAPYGAGPGLYKMNNECGDAIPLFSRCPSSHACAQPCLESPDGLENSCAVCRQPVVEVMAAMFTSFALAVTYQHMLRDAPDEALTNDFGFDLAWCNLVQHHVHGCDPRTPECTAQLGAACAYSYAIPMFHHNDRAIVKAVARNSLAFGDRGPIQRLFRSRGLQSYNMMPSWRPHSSLLWSQPCWSVRQLKAAAPQQLRDWHGPNVSAVLPVSMPDQPACCALPVAERKPIDSFKQATACPDAKTVAAEKARLLHWTAVAEGAVAPQTGRAAAAGDIFTVRRPRRRRGAGGVSTHSARIALRGEHIIRAGQRTTRRRARSGACWRHAHQLMLPTRSARAGRALLMRGGRARGAVARPAASRRQRGRPVARRRCPARFACSRRCMAPTTRTWRRGWS